MSTQKLNVIVYEHSLRQLVKNFEATAVAKGIKMFLVICDRSLNNRWFGKISDLLCTPLYKWESFKNSAKKYAISKEWNSFPILFENGFLDLFQIVNSILR